MLRNNLFVVAALLFLGKACAFAANGTVLVIDKIAPKNGAFVGVVDSSQTVTNVTNFNGNLSSADDTVQKALDTLDNLSVGGGSGAGTLAVGTGTASNFTNNITSPTSAISFHGNLFLSVAGGTTNFISLDTTTANGLLMISSAAGTYLTLSSATATYLNKLSPYVSSVNVNSPLSITANGTAGSAPTISITEVGDISSVSAGPGLTGGGSSGDITLHLDPNATHYVHNQNSLQSGATFYVSSGSVSGTLRAGTLALFTDLCASAANGGVLTTDSSGNLVCEDDDSGGAVGVSTGTNSHGTIYTSNGSTAAALSSSFAKISVFTTAGNSTNAILSTGNGQITVSTGGAFDLFAAIYSTGTGVNDVRFQLRVNGNTTGLSCIDSISARCVMSGSVNLSSGDVVSVYAAATSGTPTIYITDSQLSVSMIGGSGISGGGGSGTPSGNNTNVQYNDSGAFGGSDGFQFDSSASSVTIQGSLGVGTDSTPQIRFNTTGGDAYVELEDSPSSPGWGTHYLTSAAEIIGSESINGSSYALYLSSTSTSTHLKSRFEVGRTTGTVTFYNMAGTKTLLFGQDPYNCSGLGNGGKLTVNSDNQLVCADDSGGGGQPDFIWEPSILSPKFLSPGTTNFPKLDNSTTTAQASQYWDATSTQTVTWQKTLRPYNGGTFAVDFMFTGSTVTTGNVSWGYDAICTSASDGLNIDSLWQSYSVNASTTGAIPATAGIPGSLSLTGQTLTGCDQGDLLNFLVTRNHNGVASDAAGDIRLMSVVIREE